MSSPSHARLIKLSQSFNIQGFKINNPVNFQKGNPGPLAIKEPGLAYVLRSPLHRKEVGAIYRRGPGVRVIRVARTLPSYGPHYCLMGDSLETAK